MESTSDFAFAKDRDFRFISCSPAVLALAGLQRERDIVGKTDFDVFPADMAEQFRQNDLALFESGMSMVDYDETIHHLSGETHYCRASKYILRDAAGQIIGLYGVSHDITEERGMLEQLKLVNDTAPGGIATYSVTDGAIRITYCNDGFCKLFGGTLEGFKKRGEIDPLDWVMEEDRRALLAQIDTLVQDGAPFDCVYHIRMIDGQVKWVNQKAILTERRGNTVLFNSLLLDITERQSANEQLRISEEENCLALQHSGSLICRYDIARKTLSLSATAAAKNGLPEVLTDVPDEPVRARQISPETADAYVGFFEAIRAGNVSGTVLFQQRYLGEWRWEEAKSSTVFADDGTPVKAVISMTNVTDRIEKENIYKKWQQSLADRAPQSYTLFRTNISHRGDYDAKEGELLAFDFDHAGNNAEEVARSYAEHCIMPEDRAAYLAFVNADAMFANYYRGKRSDAIEYRETTPNGMPRWLRLTIDLVEYPNSTDVEAYMMYEDIDEAKRAELRTKERSETDPLTGILNRATFAEKANRILQRTRPRAGHALLMMDVDGFKRVNDVFGHAAGDQALVDIADGLRSMTRAGDLVGRLGGDEFVVLLNGMGDEAAVLSKAKQIRALARKSFSLEVQISASVGIAFAPRDGTDFNALYKKADSALYYVKGSGKDSQIVYSGRMKEEHLEPEPDTFGDDGGKPVAKKRRMLIVDDSSWDHSLLKNIFRDEFVIESARDGNTALIRLRHYGSAISAVLLDLMMPGINGFAVLEKMRDSAELRSIPVIVVSGDESRETCLAAIRKGATDFVTKPVDADILRVRVHSAVSKAENERLRAKNSLLELQSKEQLRYEAFLNCPGLTFIEHDWLSGAFSYHPSISTCLFGTYDDRNLWQVLLSDKVTDSGTVRDMQRLVQHVAGDEDGKNATGIVKLKTPQATTHAFRMDARKAPSDQQHANRLIISLVDLEYADASPHLKSEG